MEHTKKFSLYRHLYLDAGQCKSNISHLPFHWSFPFLLWNIPQISCLLSVDCYYFKVD
jgi:hypothetical protein